MSSDEGFAQALARYMPGIAHERGVQDKAMLSPGKLLRVHPGRYVGFADGHLFVVQRVNENTSPDELNVCDGEGLWVMWGSTPEGPYRWRFPTLKTCRDILGGMQIEWSQGATG